MTIFEAKVTSKGQITLPVKLRSALRVRTGDKLAFVQNADGSFTIGARNMTSRDLKGIVRGEGTIRDRDIQAWIEEARGQALVSKSVRRVKSQKIM